MLDLHFFRHFERWRFRVRSRHSIPAASSFQYHHRQHRDDCDYVDDQLENRHRALCRIGTFPAFLVVVDLPLFSLL
jgi:hypothetical protein